jgi:amino acid permease
MSPAAAQDQPSGSEYRPLSPEGDVDIPIVGSSSWSSIANLTNTVIGSGILTLPYAFSKSGLLLGLFLLLLCGSFSLISFYFLVYCSNKTHNFSYKAIGQQMFGQRWGLFMECVLTVYMIGSAISYQILIGDFVSQSVQSLTPGDDESWVTDRHFLIFAVGLLVLLPLSLLRRIDFLKYTSWVALFNVLFAIVVVIVYLVGAAHGVPNHPRHSDIEYVILDSHSIKAVSLMAVAFNAHYNVLNIYRELDNRSTPKMVSQVLSPSMCAVVLTYSAMAVFGYATWGSTTLSDVLNNYPISYVPAIIARIALALTIVFSYPLVSFALRNNIATIVWGSLLQRPITFRIEKAIAVGVLIFSIFVAELVDDLSKILSFTGALCGTAIIFIFPSIFYYRIRKDEGATPRQLVLPIVILVVGCLFNVIGTVEAILGLFGSD